MNYKCRGQRIHFSWSEIFIKILVIYTNCMRSICGWLPCNFYDFFRHSIFSRRYVETDTRILHSRVERLRIWEILISGSIFWARKCIFRRLYTILHKKNGWWDHHFWIVLFTIVCKHDIRVGVWHEKRLRGFRNVVFFGRDSRISK